MLDKLVLQIPFSAPWVNGKAVDPIFWNHPDPFSRLGVFSVDLYRLPFKRAASDISVSPDGVITEADLFCPWDSLPSSYGGLALKVYDTGNSKQNWPYIELKASPAKLTQGHNVFGFDDLGNAARNFYFVLHQVYPWLFGGFLDCPEMGGVLDFNNARVSEIDITYSANVPNQKHRFALISLLQSLSRGQTKTRGDQFDSSVYFGAKNSRIKKIKVYLKWLEALEDQKRRKKKKLPPIPAEILELARNLVRFELTIKARWLERREFPTKLNELVKLSEEPGWWIERFADGTADLWKALEGQEVTIMNDDSVLAAIDKVHGDVRGKTARVFGFYQSLRAVGYDLLKNQYPDRTFSRKVKELAAAGFSLAQIEALHKDSGSNVIQIPNLIDLSTLGDCRPADAKIVQLWAA